ncbi:MAG: hypothetical protein N2654_04880, partial [Deltaproteobacteria bacterium]|nr:hypothetical protein [Deltaproteobacteria bacterium]
MNICFRFLLFLLCFAVNLLCQNAVLVDGWRVDFSVLETTNTQTKVKYTFTRSNGAGTLERVVLGIPSCFPNIKPISVRFIPEGSGSVVTGPGGELRNVRTILTQAPYGILVRISNGTHSSYSLEVVWQGRYDTDGLVHVGVADIDPGPCAGQGCRGGESKVIYGIKCPQQVSGYCNASSIRGDFAIFVDTSKFVSEQSLQSIKSALKNFVINAGITNEPPIIGLGRFFYGMQNVENPNSHFCTINPQKNRCNNPFPTTRFAWDFYQATGRSEYLFSNFLSLTEPRDSYPSCRTLDGSDGDFDKNFPDPYFQLCMDY